jgi:hypothetical protein
MAVRNSAWAGTSNPNARPYVVTDPDAYVAFQGETTVIGCGECRRTVDFNDYITSINTEGSIDSPPGSATISMTIPDTDVNQFFVENQFLIVPMMEVEIYSKGYYLVGGVPKYYRIFWGIVSSVSTSWSNGTTSISISCKDILRWWELTQVVLNPAFLEGMGTSAGGYQLYQNQLAGMNPYAVIIMMARESMGDFSFTTGSFQSFTPEKGGPEKQFSTNFLGNIMAYWQQKFQNIWSSLVLYGTNGQMYTSTILGDGTSSPREMSKKILQAEWDERKTESEAATALREDIGNTAAFKIEFPRAGEVDFFQTQAQTKLSIAQEAKTQIGFEFFCDTNGDIVFKPPFYNLNVMPNKPVFWVQNFELIEDTLTDSESEVVTHITSSGNAFGGVMDWGLNDDITTPNTGVYDYHLLKQYGWRKHEFQCSWAGNPKRLFYHCLDMLDRINSKRHHGSVTIPLRPELRLGFPIYVEKYDSFFYINSISHNYAVGSSATTALTLSSRRSKFLAPSNIGTLEKTNETYTVKRTVVKKNKEARKGKGSEDKVDEKALTQTLNKWKASFENGSGDTSGANAFSRADPGRPVIVRHPKTGKLLGYPNVVMVFRTTIDNEHLGKLLQENGKNIRRARNDKQKGKDAENRYANMSKLQSDIMNLIKENKSQELVGKLRQNRYEAANSNAGAYDYAYDTSKSIRQITIIPLEAYQTGKSAENTPPPEAAGSNSTTVTSPEAKVAEPAVDPALAARKASLEKQKKTAQKVLRSAETAFKTATTDLGPKAKDIKPSDAVSTGAGDPDPKILTYFTTRDARDKAARDLAKIEAQLNPVTKKIERKAALKGGSVIVRPVSDDFGYEVIGHYRYGRGVVFNAGQGATEIPSGQRATNGRQNNISVQFAASGGLLTDSNSGINPFNNSTNSAEAFEKMTPDDWQTGAVFKGVANNNAPERDQSQGISNFSITSQQTFDSFKQSAVELNEDIIFKNAKDLVDLKPTIDLGFGTAVQNCACGIGRPNWLGLLPEGTINAILKPSGGASNTTNTPGINPNGGSRSSFIEGLKSNSPFKGVFTDNASFAESAPYGRIESTDGSQGTSQNVVIGNISTGSFFKALNESLNSKFNASYAVNQKREAEYTKSTTNPPETVNNNPVVNGNLPGQAATWSVQYPAGGSLFGAAAGGDQGAINALVGSKANWDFGLVKKALDRPIVVPPTLTPETQPNFSQLINSPYNSTTNANQPTNPFDPKFRP